VCATCRPSLPRSALTLLDLPDEALALIATHLDQRSRANLGACCRSMLASSQRQSGVWWGTITVRLLSRRESESLSAWLDRHRPATRVLDLDAFHSSIPLPEVPACE